MASWKEFEQEAPELASRVRDRFDAGKHKTLATLRRDGAPRISGTEVQLVDGELWIGSMWEALKARDLQRDPRFAIHAMPNDPESFDGGDAKIAGVAEEITDPALVRELNGDGPPGSSHLFRLDLREASVVRHNDAKDALVIEVWHPGEGVRRMERA
jgi:pyridoxamine 5'-phosphate oxidase-like protein